jgi:hypothetical protein
LKSFRQLGLTRLSLFDFKDGKKDGKNGQTMKQPLDDT